MKGVRDVSRGGERERDRDRERDGEREGKTIVYEHSRERDNRIRTLRGRAATGASGCI